MEHLYNAKHSKESTRGLEACKQTCATSTILGRRPGAVDGCVRDAEVALLAAEKRDKKMNLVFWVFKFRIEDFRDQSYGGFRLVA